MIRKAEIKDLDYIMIVINSGKAFLKSQGLDQWQDGNPNENMIINDIQNKNFYVLEVDNKIISCCAIILDDDPNYSEIYEGKWITNNKYAVIHRFATLKTNRRSGYAIEMINYTKSLIGNDMSIRIDTHIGNIPMQSLVTKCGFKLCGKIYLGHIKDDKHLRLAYEYIKTRD